MVAALVSRNTAAATTGVLVLVAGVKVELQRHLAAEIPSDGAQRQIRGCGLPLCHHQPLLPVRRMVI